MSSFRFFKGYFQKNVVHEVYQKYTVTPTYSRGFIYLFID